MDKETLKKYWKNPRTHALIVLIIWLVSLGLLMGVASLMNALNSQEKGDNPKTEEKQNEQKQEEKLQNLRSDEYLMTFLVTKKDGTLKYEGTEQNGVVNGYKEDQNGIKKYRMEKDKIYEVVLDQAMEVDTICEEIIKEFLDRQTLISLLLENEEESIIDNNENTIYEYTILYKEENVKIEVIETKEEVEKIRIESENAEYQLTFSENKN